MRTDLFGLIDIHHHILPPTAPEAMKRHMAGWSPQGALAEMDEAGIATAIGYPGPIRRGDDGERADTARAWNEFGASLGVTYPRRFGLFASLPLPCVDQTLAEIDYAFDILGADGVGVATSYGTRWLGDAAFAPVWAALDARGATVFVHPHDAPGGAPAEIGYNQPGMDGSWIEWPMNTARTIMSLMVSGTLGRFPNIRFLFAHGGGVMPLLVPRIAGLAAWAEVGEEGLKRFFPNGIEAMFGNLYFECAQACAPTNIAALRSLVPDTQILFGTDYPFFALAHGAAQFAGLALPESTAVAIAQRNARRLLPRWA